MDSEKKYIEFSNTCAGAGYGNQLRAFIKAGLLSELLKRDIIVTNYWITTLFECPYHNKWDRNINKKNKTIKKIYGTLPFEKLNFNEIKSDIIETGGGSLPLDQILINNHHKNNPLIKTINDNKYHYCSIVLQKYLNKLNKDFIYKSKKIIDYDTNEYTSIQFRIFHDAGRKNRGILDDFIKNYIKQIKDKNLSHLPIFITTDDKNVSRKISNEIKKSINTPIIHSPYPMAHSRFNNKMEILCDWLINGKSKFIYTTGTSYSLTSSLLFNTPCMLYNQKHKNALLGDLIKTNVTLM